MLNNLIDVIAKTVTPSQADIELCKAYFEPLKIARNSILEEQDKIPLNLYFISTGFMRLFYYDSDGNEVTTTISSPGDFLTPFLSFINGKNAKENIECMTDCDLLRISKLNLKALIDESENFKKFSLIIFEQAIRSTEIRANDLATLNAEQRYKKLIDEQPQVIQNIPVQYIASFLGMKPESLSRIRRQLIS